MLDAARLLFIYRKGWQKQGIVDRGSVASKSVLTTIAAFCPTGEPSNLQTTRLRTIDCRNDRRKMRLDFGPLPGGQHYNRQPAILQILLIRKIAIRRHKNVKARLFSCPQ